MGGLAGAWKCILGPAVALVLAACTSTSVKAPVERRAPGPARTHAPAHTVQAGETLYGIAFRYGLDFREVAGWNGIEPPYLIRPGRHLRLTSPGPSPSVSPASPATSTAALAEEPPPSERRGEAPAALGPVGQPSRHAPGASLAADADAEQSTMWVWPAKGHIVRGFTEAGNKGLDIAGRLGTPVRAAAAGRVVYSGSGLVGYGKLIIVKHNNTFLSAYAHNERLLVKEGESVASGQRIAHMGQTGAQEVKLHFEIRRDGKPVDPLKYLPRQRPPEEDSDA